ncbi:MAG: response regulator transcription factor [Alcanivorax sp.]|nr:response regulator transcription factor [Alcanivorax sp.]
MDSSALTIVLVEDHDALREVTADVLRQAGHRVIDLDSAEALGEANSGCSVDMYILDLNLPGEDGLSLARRLRQTHPTVGIIMVTARGEAEDLTRGYINGADIYLVKPLASDTLLASVNALGRRLRRAAASQAAEKAVILRLRALVLEGPAGNVALQDAEANLLVALIRAPGRRLEHWQIGELLAGDEDGLSKAAIEVRITRLRRKLRDAGADPLSIKALRGVGYQLCFPIVID